MLKKSYFSRYVFASLYLISITNATITQENISSLAEAPYEQSDTLEHEEIDLFDDAVSTAIDNGMLKKEPDLRVPSAPEVVLRKIATYLFMKYVVVRASCIKGYNSVKQWVINVWHKWQKVPAQTAAEAIPAVAK